VGALRRAPDSIELVTDGLSIAEVVEKLVKIVRSRMNR
jgi:cytidylate kinase